MRGIAGDEHPGELVEHHLAEVLLGAKVRRTQYGVGGMQAAGREVCWLVAVNSCRQY